MWALSLNILILRISLTLIVWIRKVQFFCIINLFRILLITLENLDILYKKLKYQNSKTMETLNNIAFAFKKKFTIFKCLIISIYMINIIIITYSLKIPDSTYVSSDRFDDSSLCLGKCLVSSFKNLFLIYQKK